MLKRVEQKLGAILTEREARGNILDPRLIAQIHPDSLLFYYGNVHSQRGQDGILAEIFRRLRLRTGNFVEFGAWDGMYLSNARFLFEKGWGGVFIEALPSRFRTLTQKYANTGVTCINAMVAAPGFGIAGKQLVELVREENVAPESIQFVSVDVDGPDLEIFLDLGFKPAVALLEGGANFAPGLTTRVANELAWSNLQQPLAVICQEVRAHGYRPVCFYQDTYLVREDLADSFLDLDPVSLYRDAFCFMPEKDRAYLLALRNDSSQIRKSETEFFGKFVVDPLGYES